GSRVYFSLSDSPGQWNNIAALNTTFSGNASFPVEFDLPLTWTNGGRLFLLWLDDNSGEGTDTANQLDNFSLRITAGTPTNFFCHVTAPLDNGAFPTGTSVTASALAVNGTGPYQVEYFTNAGPGTPF